ncbi:unnamed protein product [Gongylonema pulchrum]|uniref:Uncharacterized protein n=1 Tax=Gongylonema pulchrum TaxID=637853 RepID=A0A183DEC8_9BILA|nr:unnamed protein product [Gongylonema pulchrum]
MLTDIFKNIVVSYQRNNSPRKRTASSIDRICVLDWIHKEKKTQQKFIENRLEEIRGTDAEFRYVSTIDNPTNGCELFAPKIKDFLKKNI